ncbi:MAG: amino acid ABC transporter permease [Desulfonatronovibrionaceae bacterium]
MTGKTRFTFLDLWVIIMITAGLTILYLRVSKGLEYNWEWSFILQYLLRYDQESGSWVPGMLTQGFLTTIRISVWATLLALIMGTVIALFRTSSNLLQKLPGFSYVQVIRNIPPLVLVFIFYYFVSDQIMPLLKLEEMFKNRSPAAQTILSFLFASGSELPLFFSAVLSLAVYEASYMAEIIRGGINSVPHGQRETAAALGFNTRQQMRLIILPQAFQRALPPLAGQFISTIKDSAIVSIISVQELTFQGLELMAATYKTFEIWITITVLYFSLTFTCSRIIGRLEKRLGRHL